MYKLFLSLVISSGISFASMINGIAITVNDEPITIYDIEKTATIINMVVLLGFIFYFYKNLKNISATSSVSNLMKDIIKTRRIVKYYVWYNLVIAGITGMIVIYFQSKYDNNLNVLLEKYESVFIVCCVLLVLFLVLIFYLFYKLLIEHYKVYFF